MIRGKNSIFENKYWIVIIASFCSFLWGSAFPLLKISYIEMNMMSDDLNAKIVFAGMRFFLASILLFIFLFIEQRKIPGITKRVLGELLILGLLQTSLQYFFFYVGLAHTSGMKASILQSAGSFFVVFLAHFFYTNDKLNWQKSIGLITGLLGIILVNSNQGFDLVFSWEGEGFLIISGLVSAFGTILAKRLARDLHPFLITGWQMLLGSIILLLIGLPGLSPHAMTFTPKAWILFIYSAFLSAAAFSLWYSLLKYHKAGVITVYKFLVPVFGTILSALFIAGEKINFIMFAALILVALGIVVVNYNSSRSTKKLYNS